MSWLMTVGIGAVGHCNVQVVGLDKFDFVDCEAAVRVMEAIARSFPSENVFLK